MKIKAAIFDMDGTIIDSLVFWDYLWRSIGKKYMGNEDFKPSEEVDKKVRTMIFKDAMTFFKSYYSLPVDTEDFISFTSGGIVDFYRDIARAKAGAIELLEHLKTGGIKICLASASEMSVIKYALERHGMLKYFDALLSCADIGVGKDRPDIYLMARERLGAPTEEICVFEDSFVALEVARNVGFKTVGIFDKYNLEQGRVKNAADIYLGEGMSLDTLIPLIYV